MYVRSQRYLVLIWFTFVEDTILHIPILIFSGIEFIPFKKRLCASSQYFLLLAFDRTTVTCNTSKLRPETQHISGFLLLRVTRKGQLLPKVKYV